MFEFSRDHRLVNGCAQGRKECWDQFVDRFSKLIYWSIRKTLKDGPLGSRQEELCQEIFQEFFEKILEKKELDRLRQVESLGKFLSVMACHHTLDKIRTLMRSEQKIEAGPMDLTEIQSSQASPGTAAETKEKNKLIEGLLLKLAPRERATIELYYMDGKSHSEIGNILGIPQNTVSSLIRRTRERLKGQLDRRRINDY